MWQPLKREPSRSQSRRRVFRKTVCHFKGNATARSVQRPRAWSRACLNAGKGQMPVYRITYKSSLALADEVVFGSVAYVSEDGLFLDIRLRPVQDGVIRRVLIAAIAVYEEIPDRPN